MDTEEEGGGRDGDALAAGSVCQSLPDLLRVLAGEETEQNSLGLWVD